MNLRKNILMFVLVGGLTVGGSCSAALSDFTSKITAENTKALLVSGINAARNANLRELALTVLMPTATYLVVDKLETTDRWNRWTKKVLYDNEYNLVKWSGISLATLSSFKPYILSAGVSEDFYNKVWGTIALSTILGKLGAKAWHYYNDKSVEAPAPFVETAPVKYANDAKQEVKDLYLKNTKEHIGKLSTNNKTFSDFTLKNTLAGVQFTAPVNPGVLDVNADEGVTEGYLKSVQQVNDAYKKYATNLVDARKAALDEQKGNTMYLVAGTVVGAKMIHYAMSYAGKVLANIK